MTDSRFPCPSCGFLVFSEPPGSYEICAVCGWEDDHVQLKHPSMGGGANKLSLAEHQARALRTFPVGVSVVYTYNRSTEWRPLLRSELASHPMPTDGLSYFNAAGEDSPPYYWLRLPPG